MTKSDTPYKRAVHMILHSIINLEPEYVLRETYVRWGKVEQDLFELEERYLSAVERIKEILKGIDETETESIQGWWETSTGAKFGAEKLSAILKLFGEGK